MLLGNDLAGGKVVAEPIVTHESHLAAPEDDDEELYPACAVTKAMNSKSPNDGSSSKIKPNVEVDLETTFFSRFDEDQISSSDQPVSTREQLIEGHKRDPELDKLRENALSPQEAEEVPICYYIQEDVLLRKFRPPDASSDEEWRIVHHIFRT